MGTYFAALQSMWEELDHYETYRPACSQDVVAYNAKVKRTHIFEFLTGLNAEFELVRVHILSRDTLPSLNEIYAFVQSEDSRHSVMQQYSPSTAERSALVTTSASQRSAKGYAQKKTFNTSFGDQDKGS